MTPDEYREALWGIVLKRSRNEALTRREERLWAYRIAGMCPCERR